MSSQQQLLDEKNQDEKEEKKEPEATMELELYGIKCDICEETYDADKVFICKHLECAKNCGIYCEDCGAFKHKKKTHNFQPSARYVICVQDLYRPDQTNFEGAKEKAKTIVLNISRVESFLFYHRWHMGLSKIISTAGVTIASAVASGAATAAGSIVSGLGMGAACGAIGAVVATGIESGFIFRQWWLGRITTKEAWAFAGISLVSNGTAVGAAVGGAALGAKIGALIGVVGGPAGLAIGIAGGAVFGLLCGFFARYKMNKQFEKYFKDKHKLEQKLVEEALNFFFHDKNYDIDDKKKFNGKLLRRTYRRLALIYHPEREGGDHDDWLKLSSYYGILTGIWEKMNGEAVEINSSDDLNEQQRSLVLSEVIRAANV